MPRIVLSTATYRSFEFLYVIGLMSLGWPSPEVKARLAALDAEITPASACGYGGGRNLSQLFVGAIEFGADYVLTIDSDMAWTADHVVRVIEAERFLRAKMGCPVIVGAVYPQSRMPDSQIVCEVRDGVRLPIHDGDDPDPAVHAMLAERLARGVELRDTPDAMERYAESWLLPTGFVLWPVEPFRTCAGMVGERLSATECLMWDNAMSDVARHNGARLFMDLALDVGHMSIKPVTSVGRMAERAGFR